MSGLTISYRFDSISFDTFSVSILTSISLVSEPYQVFYPHSSIISVTFPIPYDTLTEFDVSSGLGVVFDKYKCVKW